MTDTALLLGPLEAQGFDVARSGIKWLRQSGSYCEKGDVLGFCNIGLAATDRSSINPFRQDRRDFQVAFISPVAGRLTIPDQGLDGGMLDQLAFRRWKAGDVLCVFGESDPQQRTDARQQVRLLVMSGRRMSELAEVRSGPLSGWHDRSRAWSAESDPQTIRTVVGIGICDLTDVLRGPSQTYSEFIQKAPAGIHIVRALDEPLAPCARVLVEQMQRTAAQEADIARDLTRSLTIYETPAAPSDLIFVGSVMAGLQRRAITDQYPILTRTGLSQSDKPDAIVLSLQAEPRRVFRHRRLGYTVCIHNHRMQEFHPWLMRWMVDNFEPVNRSVATIKTDLVDLLNLLDPNTSVLILNRVVDALGEDIQNYQGLGEHLETASSSVYDRQMNLMLHDLVSDYGVGLIDVEMIASELGQRRHTMDTMHHSAAIQSVIQDEIAAALASRKTLRGRSDAAR